MFHKILPYTKTMFADDELVEKLIEEVEKRPVLYDKMCTEYKDAHFKKRMWEEVIVELLGTARWEEMSSEQKSNAVKELQSRWINLRNCFSRELRLQRDPSKSGHNAKRRRTYIHFEKLMFLLPTMELREPINNLSIKMNDTEDVDELSNQSTSSTEGTQPSHSSKKKLHMSNSCNMEQSTNKASIKYSEDHNFALSLVPMLQRLSIYDKIDAKVQILNIFKEKCGPPTDPNRTRTIKEERFLARSNSQCRGDDPLDFQY